MLFVTATLLLLLAAALLVAGRELTSFKQEPAWKNISDLKERFLEELPPAPLHDQAGRAATVEYCRRMRSEFLFAWRLCRFLAPISRDSGYVTDLLMTTLRFHGLLAQALVQATAGRSASCDRLVGELRDLSSLIRKSALEILTESDLQQGMGAA